VVSGTAALGAALTGFIDTHPRTATSPESYGNSEP